jgi:hypothetical protein
MGWSEEEAMGGDYYMDYERKEAEKKKVVGSFYLVGKLRSAEFSFANVTSTQKGSLIGWPVIERRSTGGCVKIWVYAG